MVQKKYSVIEKAAVLCILPISYMISLATPALGAIAAAFPDISPDLIKQVAALPNLTAIVASLLVGPLDRIMSKRKLLSLGMIIIFLGSLAPAIGGGFYFILVCRGVMGLGYGVVFSLALAYVPELFEPGKERETMMGWGASAGALSGIIFMTVGGLLAAYYWRFAFWGALVGLPAMILIWLKLPEPERKAKPEVVNGEAQSKLIRPMTWVYLFFNMIAMFLIFSFITNMAIVVSVLDIGSPVISGNILSVFTIGTFLNGLFAGKVRGWLKRFYFPVGVALIGLSMVLLINFQIISMYFVAAFIFGLGFSIYNIDIALRVAESAHVSATTLAMSLFLALNGIGQFLSPIVLVFLGGALGIQGALTGWMISGPTLLVFAAVIIVLEVFNKSKKQNVTISE